MSTHVRTDDQRARMNALYSRLRNGSDALFLHDDLIHFGCPKSVVKAYVEARADGVDVVPSLAMAHFGRDALGVIRDYPTGAIARAANGWAWRLEQLEAQANISVARVAA